jgi:hypothetical protein
MPRLFTVAVAGLAFSLFAAPAFCAGVKVLKEEEVRRRQGVELAGRLTKILPGILKTFQARRRALPTVPGSSRYEAAAVESLLRETEGSLQRALEGDDFAPLRDYVSSVFNARRESLALPRQAHLPAPRGRRILRAAWSAETGPAGIDRAAADSAFGELAGLIQKFFSRAKKRDLNVTLCVVSLPAGKTFTMSARSLPDKVYETYTNGEVIDAYRGIYDYELGAIHCGPPPKCPPVDLWDGLPVLECDLAIPACRPREHARGDCRRGRR